MFTTLISARELQQLMASGAPLRVYDCSFELMKPEAGAAQYTEEHIPGSVYVHLDHHLSDKQGADRASGGRHPLPSRETIARRMASLGLSDGEQVVVLDRQGANYCGRLWWMLKWCGHEAVAVLDGGLAAWKAAGGALASGPSPTPEPGHFTLKPTAAATASTNSISTSLGRSTQTLIDARAGARFRGEVEPLDPVAGHIPGATLRPFTANLQPDGRFKPAAQLRAEFDRLATPPAQVVHQCGSGVTACHNLLAMAHAGLEGSRLYPGSWSEWCADPARPVALG